MNYLETKLRFGAVIVTYNRLDLLKECVFNIFNQNRRFDKIIIVNNHSTDGTEMFLKSIYNENGLSIITTEDNLGGAGGFKIGVEASYKYVDYLLLIDDDAILCPNFLENIEHSIVPNIMAYSGTVVTDGKIDTTHRRLLKNRTFMTHQDVALCEYTNDHFDYDLSTFCGLMLKTSLIDIIGLPKSEYFIWYDDSEYSLRISEYTKIRNVNSSVINHKTKLNYTDRLTWKSYYGYRNKIDMGMSFSRHPIVFKTCRLAYHLFRCIQYAFLSLSLSKIEHDYYSYSSKMMLDVIKDSIFGVLGKNYKYLP